MLGTIKWTGVALLVGCTVGCASWQAPAQPGSSYFCKPASAIRYRGEVNEKAVAIRPAPAHGSCRNAR